MVVEFCACPKCNGIKHKNVQHSRRNIVVDRVPTDNVDIEGGVVFYPIALREAEPRPLMTKLVFPDCISLRQTKRGCAYLSGTFGT